MPAPAILVIGGGVSGLACAVTLTARAIPVAVHEQEARVGGHARTEQVGSFRFDRGPHVLLGIPTEVRELFSRLDLPVQRCTCESTIYFERYGVHVPAPLQANIGALPAAVRARCAAHYLVQRLRPHGAPRDHREQATQALGRGMVELFVEPYARKRLALATADIHPTWTSRMPSPTPKAVMWDGLITRRTQMGLDSAFSYPTNGGIERLPLALAGLLPPATIQTGDPLVELDVVRRRATFATGAVRDYRALVSSIPLRKLLALVPDLPGDVRSAGEELVFASTYVINLGVAGRLPGSHGIIRFPENDIPFYRLSFPTIYNRDCAPAGHDAVVAEVGHHPSRRALTADEATEQTLVALQRIGVVPERERVVSTEVVAVEIGHVIHGHRTPRALDHIATWLRSHGIHLCGKYGTWREMLMPQSMLSGVQAAEAAARELDGDHV